MKFLVLVPLLLALALLPGALACDDDEGPDECEKGCGMWFECSPPTDLTEAECVEACHDGAEMFCATECASQNSCDEWSACRSECLQAM